MTRSLGLFALTLSALIFGFFYAWTCSTMWGLDAADPRIAIAAMQAMNASVRNAVFAPAFFGTGPALLAVAILARNQRGAALLFLAASVTYTIFGMGLTMVVNVPMNAALARLPVPDDMQAGGRLVSAGDITFSIQDIGYWDPNMIVFYGELSDGSAVELVQHISQLNLLLVAVPRHDDIEKPRRIIGFNRKNEPDIATDPED